jgi:hypothetical protein
MREARGRGGESVEEESVDIIVCPVAVLVFSILQGFDRKIKFMCRDQ